MCFFIIINLLLVLLIVVNTAISSGLGDEQPQEEISSIVWWTSLLFPHLEDTAKIKCEKSVCLSTRKKLKRKHGSIAYIFYGTDFELDNLPLPRQQNQIWALLHEESPMNNFIFSHSAGIQLFNYSGTFSRYSDFPLTTQFLPSLEYLTERKPIPISQKNKLRSMGFAPVLYAQSHCNVASDRDRYVKQLMKYIDIDSYGSCLHNKNLPVNLTSTETYNSEEFLDFISQYKFHISFENAICDDYITEKLFRPLHVGSVPIYKGSKSVKDWVPQNSVIVADDFDSPKSLVDFIKQLDQNDDLYNGFLSFKNGITNEYLKTVILERQWGVNSEDKIDFIKGFECFICDKLVKQNCFSKNVLDVKIATKKHMNCHQPYPHAEINTLLQDDGWLKEGWVENYWFAYDQARAIQKMIQKRENNSRNFMQYLMEYSPYH